MDVRATAGNDNTVQRRVGRLDPGRRYFYRFTGRGGQRSDVGTFVTAPRRSQNAKLEFAFTGDTDFSPAPGTRPRPTGTTGGVFRQMRAERNSFNIHFGDTIYSDSEVPGALNPIALDGPAEVGQVQGQPRRTRTCAPCGARRASSRTGTTTSS